MMIPLTHFINLNCHSTFLVHLVLHYNEMDSLNYANEHSGKRYESLLAAWSTNSVLFSSNHFKNHMRLGLIYLIMLLVDVYYNGRDHR